MRACDIPEALFNEIMLANQQRRGRKAKFWKVNLDDGGSIKVLCLKKREAIIGVTNKKSDVGVGDITSLKFWYFDFQTSLKLQELVYSNPHFVIMAGPFYGKRRHRKKGREIIETLVVQNNNPSNILGFYINCPFRVFIRSIEDDAKTMQDEKVTERKYWERFMGGRYLELEKEQAHPP